MLARVHGAVRITEQAFRARGLATGPGCVALVTITVFSPDSITEIPQLTSGVAGLFGV